MVRQPDGGVATNGAFLILELSSRRRNNQTILIKASHFSSSLRPASSRLFTGANDNASRFRLEFDFISQLGLGNNGFRKPQTT